MSNPYPWFSFTLFLFGRGLTVSLVNEVFYARRDAAEPNPPIRKTIYFAVYWWSSNFKGRPLIKWEEK